MGVRSWRGWPNCPGCTEWLEWSDFWRFSRCWGSIKLSGVSSIGWSWVAVKIEFCSVVYLLCSSCIYSLVSGTWVRRWTTLTSQRGCIETATKTTAFCCRTFTRCTGPCKLSPLWVTATSVKATSTNSISTCFGCSLALGITRSWLGQSLRWSQQSLRTRSPWITNLKFWRIFIKSLVWMTSWWIKSASFCLIITTNFLPKKTRKSFYRNYP